MKLKYMIVSVATKQHCIQTQKTKPRVENKHGRHQKNNIKYIIFPQQQQQKHSIQCDTEVKLSPWTYQLTLHNNKDQLSVRTACS